MTGTVSDHAVLRYLQRHCGVDVEAIREGLRSRALDAAAGFPAATVIITGGHLVVREGVAVTFVAAPRKAKRVRPPRDDT